MALQLLFQQDVNRQPKRPLMERFVHDRLNDAVAEPFCLSLFDGVMSHQKEIDLKLTAAADNWRLHRMSAVDRNVLRLGVYEMVYMPEPTPGPVALDEAIELSRRYGSKDSPAFVNGVLDKLYQLKIAQDKKSKLASAEAS